MQKLGSLVEERRIVLIAFQDEVLPLPQSEAAAEIFRDAAYEKGRLLARGLKNPREHRSSRRLAVRAGHHDGLACPQKQIGQRFRQRAKKNALVQHVLQFHVASGDGIAHHHPIRARLEVGFSVRLGHGNGRGGQKVGHWGIRGCVRAGYFESTLLEQPGQRRHGRTANTNQVNMLLIHVSKING